MKISHHLFQTIILAGSFLVLASASLVVLAAAQTQGSCPPIIASLFPKNASNLAGQYFPGDMGQGQGSAEVSFDDPICPISVDLAKAAIAEVFANLEKADFSKAK